MDIDALLQSLGDEEPSGEDLEYDPDFTELEIEAQFGEEQQVGDDIIAASEPDFKEVATKAEAILARSHDIRAAIYLGEAQLRLSGFPGFAEVTTYIRRALEEFWDSCHPQLDEEDDNDPTMRVNAVFGLADPTRMIPGVRKAALTDSRMFGRISLRDIAVADGEITPPADMENVPDAAAVAAAFQDTEEETLRGIAEGVSTALSDVQAIDEIFNTQTPGLGPDLEPLIKLLKQANTKITNALGDPVGEVDASEDSAAEPGAAPVMAGGGGGGAINTPTDVQNALDRIIAYYERSEPSSPVPILLLRAKKLVSADFLTIVKDMAPLGVDNVNLIGGIEEEY